MVVNSQPVYISGDCSKLTVKTAFCKHRLVRQKEQMFRQTLLFLASLAEHFKKNTTFAKTLKLYG